MEEKLNTPTRQVELWNESLERYDACFASDILFQLLRLKNDTGTLQSSAEAIYTDWLFYYNERYPEVSISQIFLDVGCVCIALLSPHWKYCSSMIYMCILRGVCVWILDENDFLPSPRFIMYVMHAIFFSFVVPTTSLPTYIIAHQ